MCSSVELVLATPDATSNLAISLAGLLRHGDTILLEGPIGAGKTHFARALIQHLLAANGTIEDVPSPTFTLVQTYQTKDLEIWHADLYRLTSPDDVQELGLDEAMQDFVTLIEWPDRMGTMVPADACRVQFEAVEDHRKARLTWSVPRLEAWLSAFTAAA